MFERGFCKWKLATDGKGFWDDGKNIYTKRDESEQNDLYTNEVNTGVRADGEMNRNMKKTKKVGKTRKGKETTGGRGPRGALSGWNGKLNFMEYFLFEMLNIIEHLSCEFLFSILVLLRLVLISNRGLVACTSSFLWG